MGRVLGVDYNYDSVQCISYIISAPSFQNTLCKALYRESNKNTPTLVTIKIHIAVRSIFLD